MLHFLYPMLIAACFSVACFLPAFAQTSTPQTAIPSSIRQSMQALGDLELFLVDIEKSKSALKIGKPVNITRRAGYDNQPSFTPDNRAILYVAMREDMQSDVYRYDIKDSATTQITKTPESEYTPTVIPADGKSIMVVRVEPDSTQRLWRFDANGANPTMLLDSTKRVGYYGWLGASNLGLFVLGRSRGEGFSLQISPFDAENPHGTGLPKPDSIESSIGRCIRRVPTSIAGSPLAASFVHKLNDSLWMIKRVNVKNRIVSQICPTVRGAEDYAWMQNGTLIMGRDLKLFARHARKDNAWREIADFTGVIAKGYIKRLALSPDEKRLVMVVQENP
ncbi:MAG: TolB family protein [Candidatus Kapaibacteriota bacterium]|jgi:hypothetical protein